ncbi:TIGR00730 family Rossman fold protein [Desertimonas flava]|uniref:LOG family protein n=1 Tax=Desertimonas flava TaxID=2064846 RepID=UPI000E34E0B0|nr:TIGR00730 family Rossman fold protein [Desertimonas flava]
MRRICVYAGSSPGSDPAFADAAAALGAEIAARGLGLVYGGSNVGLMGVVADAATAAGGTVIGVLPSVLQDKEIAHRGIADLRIVDNMHERKLAMIELSDGFVTLPGGSGTLEELFEVFTWQQIGLHRKPVGLLDVNGFWQPLVALIDHIVDSRLLRREHADRLLVDADAASLLDRFESFDPPVIDKWMDRASGPTSA